MGSCLPEEFLQASALASLFSQVPHVADIIVQNISIHDMTALFLKTEPALYRFCIGSGGGFHRLLKLCLRASALASLFFKAPKVADIIAYNLDFYDPAIFFTKTDPALYHFCQGRQGGLARFERICKEGKSRRKYLSRLPDFPRLLVEEWREKLMGKRLIKDGMDGGDDVGLLRNDT